MPSLQPRKSFTITPRADFTFRPKLVTAKHGNVGVYRVGPQNRFVLRERTGRLSEKGISGMINRYYEQGGERVGKIFVYSQKSNVLRGTRNLLAVKIRDEKGWITREGKFIGVEQFENILYSIDSTVVGAGGDNDNLRLLQKWESLSKRQQANVVDAFRNFDWDAFWAEWYPRFTLTVNAKGQIVKKRRPGSETWETDHQIRMYDRIVKIFGDASRL